MQKICRVLPFIAVFMVLMGSVWLARALHAHTDRTYSVNTMPDQNGIVHSVRVFESIESVVIIDSKNHARKKHIAASAYSYNRENTQLLFSEPLPFAEPVVHIEGVSVQPEQFCIADFSGTHNELLVLLKDRVAIEDYEYTYNADTHIITFRSDLHPESDGNFHLAYQTVDGALHGFGNWSKKDVDTLSTLQWQWMHKTQGAPMLVMKDRTGVSDRTLRREVGFSVQLPKGNSTFLSETMDGMQKIYSVMRWYDDVNLMIECKPTPFSPADTVESEKTVHIGKLTVTKQEIIGVQSTGTSKANRVPLVVYLWQHDGTYYQMTTEPMQTNAAERLLTVHN